VGDTACDEPEALHGFTVQSEPYGDHPAGDCPFMVIFWQNRGLWKGYSGAIRRHKGSISFFQCMATRILGYPIPAHGNLMGLFQQTLK
jgi:hypothetical protein